MAVVRPGNANWCTLRSRLPEPQTHSGRHTVREVFTTAFRFAVFLLLFECLCLGRSANDEHRVDVLLPVLMEKAWGMDPHGLLVLAGIELEEDSGDDPTIKLPIHFRWSISRRILLTGSAEMIRFNQAWYTAWAPSNSSVGLQLRFWFDYLF